MANGAVTRGMRGLPVRTANMALGPSFRHDYSGQTGSLPGTRPAPGRMGCAVALPAPPAERWLTTRPRPGLVAGSDGAGLGPGHRPGEGVTDGRAGSSRSPPPGPPAARSLPPG